MKEIIKNTFLYFSAFIPMYFLIQLKFVVDIILGNIEVNFFTITVLLFLLLVIILGIVGLLWNISWNKDKADKVKIIKSTNITDQHFLGYFSIFILFALSFDLTKVSMFCIFIFILIFVGIVYVNNKLFFINPLLNILGFNFYEVTYVKENETSEKNAKIFYRGKMQATDAIRNIKLKNENFSFIDKKNDKTTTNEEIEGTYEQN